MYPVLFQLTVGGADIPISSYRFFLLVAAVAGVVAAWVTASRLDVPRRKLALLLLSIVVAVPLGARALDWLTHTGQYRNDPTMLWSTNATGFALYGGLLAAAIAGWFACRRLGLELWPTADAVAPAAGLSAAVVRIGCFLNACCPGKPTSLPWGIVYPAKGGRLSALSDVGLGFGRLLTEAAKPVATHPVELYELLAAVTGGILALILLKRRTPAGTPFLALILWLTTWRWLIFYVREPGSGFSAPAWFYPALFAAVILACAALLSARYRELLFVAKEPIADRP